MKKLLLIVAVLLYWPCAAQVNKEVDSLLKVLDTEKQDSNIQRTLNRIGNYYIDNNPTKAIEYLERSAELARQLNFSLRLANNYYDIGFCYLLKSDFDKSLNFYQQSAKIYETLKDNHRLANAYMSMGNVFFQSKSLPKADEYYDKAEAIVKQTKDSGQLASLYAERGNMYDQEQHYDSAIAFMQKSIAIAKLINDDFMVTNGLSNMGLTYKHKKNTALALQYFDTVLKKYNAMKDPPVDNLAIVFNNVGATQSQAGNYTKAIDAFNKSIGYSTQEGLSAVLMENYRNMADMFADMKDYKQQSIYLTKYHQLKDSLYSNDSKNLLTQLEADYQLEKKNISLVKQEAETTKQKSQRNIFIIIAIGAALLLAALGFFYRRIKQNNILLQEKNIQINKQKDELQTLNHVKDRLFSIISHDLRNPLVTLNGYLSLAENTSLPEEKKEKFRQQTQQAVSQTSNMLDNLLVWANMQIKNTKPTITNINVEDCIDDAIGAARAQATQKNILIDKNIITTMATADHNIIEIALRNIITNAVKYSQANGHITVSSFSDQFHTFIAVKDEGIGMSKDKIEELLNNEAESKTGTHGEKGSGLGLFLVKELLQKINAVLLIESEEGSGSSFIIQLGAG
ncbi:tetratricopeptide repeat protein [Ferruginibacter sp. SUN106]|uniref:tetratricopeptide repeat protein n=1 Tax=Ferruginibacter sp. SUN106 TaxID=2978348 RepID=UPI003D35B57D